VRIAYVSQDFVPEVGAGPARVLELSRRWVAAGHQVSVVCGMPRRRVPTAVAADARARFARRPVAKEIVDGITVLRTAALPLSSQRITPRALHDASFAAGATLHALAGLGPIDLVIATAPPWFPQYTGRLLSWARSVPLVLEIRDLWPDYLIELGVLRPDGGLTKVLFASERRLLAGCAAAVTVTESFRRRLVGKGVASEKVHVIPNGVVVHQFPPLVGPAQHNGTGPVVGYLGTFGKGQALETVIAAAKVLEERGDRVRFRLVGDGPEIETVRSAIGAHGVSSVEVSPPIPKDATAAFYAGCDVCLVPLAPVPIFEETVPSKLFEVMVTGRPLVASVAGEAAAIVTESRGGVVARPGDPREIAHAIAGVLAMPPNEREAMGMRARDYVSTHYDRERLADRYLGILEGVVRRSATAGGVRA
jgi:glycosyltransferase involved in cell wall biosynthesis